MKYNIYDATIDVIGAWFTAENFQTIIGIIVGVLTLINILIKMGFKIYEAIKNKKYKDIPEIIDETKEEIKEVGDNAKN